MKKNIIPIIALLGTGAALVGCAPKLNVKKEAFINNLNSFKEDLYEYTSVNEKSLNKTAFNKYNLSLESENLDNLHDFQDNLQTNINEINNTDENDDVEIEISSSNSENKEENQKFDENQKFSTLYSLSSDIEDSCDEFCELKEDITQAIIETQNLIDKLQQKELKLTKEQRMFITEQSMQLKNLGRQLANITTELSFNLSDINQLMLENSDDVDNLNLKYLVVLDNLVNGNEMLQSSLSSLNLINQMFNTTTILPPNNQGRILYGFKHNNNPPVIKDYYIDENGNMVETPQNTESDNQPQNEQTTDKEQTNIIDTYQNNALKTNIDTYQNNNMPRNIDTFFNTALLDNEFMYGYGGGYGGMYGPMNPYMQHNAYNNTNYSVHNVENTQHNEQKQNITSTKKERKKIQLKKNIDTYKDENEPDIRTKLGNIKNTISGFFSKFKKSDLNDKITNPVYREDKLSQD